MKSDAIEQRKLYVVTLLDCGGYESQDISYHLTRKGVLKFIMQCKYENWEACRYIEPNSYEDEHFYIYERELKD